MYIFKVLILKEFLFFKRMDCYIPIIYNIYIPVSKLLVIYSNTASNHIKPIVKTINETQYSK